ncbi:hypothetical protein MNEG_14786 [Monoraphidium neglectum]|uniref:Uncharacterized protein n=1 Tax=Monoraphidium neglectum TaxID=145388 RepID=A0A0D2IZC5_9CHLO|nr:hypothetical protein MNEG_14786 [Monoraphidium neglectum]KIY93177.1 hypothetical protein MNEG_14786 [Monoraphidium neglectum]|eukprot:XP_013892197.1 hypothetical protein MNEG_14786 [Monoraphidium neglectum]
MEAGRSRAHAPARDAGLDGADGLGALAFDSAVSFAHHPRPAQHMRGVGDLDISVRSGRSYVSAASSKVTQQVDIADDEPPLSVREALGGAGVGGEAPM